jgi:hypothetical protein
MQLHTHEPVIYKRHVSSLQTDTVGRLGSSNIRCLDALFGLETNCLSSRYGGCPPVSRHTTDNRRVGAPLGRLMRDLIQCGAPVAPPSVPTGIAFEIADLLFVGLWADNHNLRMLVCLDHGAAVGEEYEEVIAFQTTTSSLYRFIMWRNAEAIFVQPLVGRRERYGSVVAALESPGYDRRSPAWSRVP